MLYEQTRIDVEPRRNETKMNYTIWQSTTNCKPWAVHFEGYRSGYLEIVIIHEDINLGRGFARFKKVKAQNPRHFVEFVYKQLSVFASFASNNLEVRPIDAISLYGGYCEGVKKTIG